MRRASLSLLAGAMLLPAAMSAQPVIGLPELELLNPTLAARSGLFAPGIVVLRGGWTSTTLAEYGTAIERRVNSPDSYLLDAEVMRVQTTAYRALGPRTFLMLQAGASGAHAGFADSFFDGFHNVVGFVMPERDARPRNSYGYWIDLPERGVYWSPRPGPIQLADLRVGAGWQAPGLQTLLALTLPTASPGNPFGRGVPTVSLMQSARFQAGSHVALEGSAGIGHARRNGALREIQREWTRIASAGLTWRLTDRLSFYGALVGHSAGYSGSGIPELDRGALVSDAGIILGRVGGRRWRIGVTEDLRREDAGLDFAVKIGGM